MASADDVYSEDIEDGKVKGHWISEFTSDKNYVLCHNSMSHKPC